MDISNPNDPQPVGVYDGAESVSEVTVAGGYAYAAAGHEGLQVWDISNPAAPLEIGSYDPSWSICHVTVAGNYAYLPHRTGMAVVDISNPTAPVEVGSHHLPDQGMHISDVAVSGNYVYIASSGLLVVDVSNPAAPVEVGVYRKGGQAVAASGSTVYLGSRDGLRIVDVSNPATPNLIGYYAEPYRSVTSIVLAGSRAYLGVEESGESYGGLRVVDVSNPSNPTLVGAYDTPGYYSDKSTIGLAVQGTYAYLAAEEAGLRVVDVSDPSVPTEASFYVAAGEAASVAAAGDLVYVGDSAGGLRVVDVSNPAAPRQVGFYDLPVPANGVAATCEYIYVAAGGDGLYILRYADAACYSISGRVTDAQSHPIAGVQIAAGATHHATTGADGRYTLTDLAPGAYTLTPSRAGYFFSPGTRTVTVPPSATGQDFVGRHIIKESAIPSYQALGYGEPLTYTVRLIYPHDRTRVLYDPVPTDTAYISGSLSAPAGVAYYTATHAISGTLNLTASLLTTVTFAVRVAVTGTAESPRSSPTGPASIRWTGDWRTVSGRTRYGTLPTCGRSTCRLS